MEGKKRLHFGVLFSNIDNSNQYDVWNGITRYAAAHDIHLTGYIGTYLDSDSFFSSNMDTCLETIRNNASLDGFILLSGFLAWHIGVDNLGEYVARLPKHLPVVSVSFSIPGIPSVLVDNVKGMYGAVDHLIKVHGKERIAFVKGPDGHSEAEDRLLGYKKALEDNGIAFDERYVFPGQFSQECGTNAVVAAMEERGLDVDAYVTSNDQNAIGVLNELRNRNVLVPTDCVVVGFDDDDVSVAFTPSLSTVRQDFVDIGFASALTLHNRINGKPVDEINYLVPVFMARQSCGCMEREDKSGVLADSLLSHARENFRQVFAGALSGAQIREYAVVIAGWMTEKTFDREAFLRSFKDILFGYNHLDKDLNLWVDAIDLLAKGVERHADEVANAPQVLSALLSATSLVHDIKRKREITAELELNGSRSHIRRTTSSLVLSFDIDSLADRLCKSLPELSMNMVLIGLYASPIKRGAANADRAIDTLIGFDGDRRFSMRHNTWNPILFSDYSTIDRFEFDRERRTLLFIPLFFDDEELGIILLPHDPNLIVDAYELLRVSISTAVKGAELVSKIQTLSITDDLTGLLNRRGFFQFAYSRLLHMRRNTLSVPLVMFMDMDKLKAINDTHGHNEGDVAIRAFAKILRDALREEDIIGRVGGDEFVVLSSVRANENGEHVVRRIRAKFDEYNQLGHHVYQVACSIGSVVLDEATRESFEAAMLSADNVLYEEKMEKKKKGLTK